MKPVGHVHLVGAGPGDPDLLTLSAARLIGTAEALVHDRLVSHDILALSRPGTRMVPVGKVPGHHSVPQERINDILINLAREGLEVVRLKGGDPLIFGRGSEEATALRRAGIPVSVVPGITAAQGMAATTGVPLTHRGVATGVRYVTGHRKSDEPLDLDWKSLADPATTLVIYMGVANIAQIAFELIRAGLTPNTPVMAVTNATRCDQSNHISRLDRIGLEMRTLNIAGPVLFVIGDVVGLYRAEADTDGPLASLHHDIGSEAIRV